MVRSTAIFALSAINANLDGSLQNIDPRCQDDNAPKKQKYLLPQFCVRIVAHGFFKIRNLANTMFLALKFETLLQQKLIILFNSIIRKLEFTL